MQNNTELSNNPFYILEVSPCDKRATIINKAEEKSFFLEGNTCEEAQAKLLNPSRRLLAELDWFLDIDDKKRNEINKCINENKEIDMEDPISFWRINALLYNFSIMQNMESYDVGYMLIDIDDQFSLADTYDLADKINACRKEAGMKFVTEAEVSEALTEKRDSIRTVLSEKLQELLEQEYISLINTISDNCIADPDYEYGVVIADIIDQYEIKYQSEIDKISNEILTHIDRIKRLSKEEAFEENLPRLIRRLKKWHKIVKPILTRAIASGLEHPGIDKITHGTRELTVFLHNEKGWTESAYELAVELRKLFDGSGELSERLENDEDTLREILEDSKASSALLAKLNEFADTAEYIIDNVCVERVDSFVDALVEINREIKEENLGEELTYKLRERIFYIARGVILKLHNDHHRTTHSVRIATALKLHFTDIASLQKVASDDLAALMSQLVPPRNNNTTASKKSPGTSPLGCLIIGLIVLLLIVIPIGLSTCDSSGPKEEYKFSQSADAYDDVYVDIVSIEPSVGIYTEGSYTNTNVACKCKTSDGKTVWVYMSVYEYNKYIDSSAKISNSVNADYDVKYYSTAKRIHGTARKADSLCEGLSSDTGTMVLYFESIE